MSVSACEMLQGVRVVPSILSADFGRLGEQVKEVLDAGARVIHVDVMDGHFVPPITVGPLIVAALAQSVREADAMLEVHLMIERPERQVSEFVKAGAQSVTFHVEATPNVAYTASLIRESGACVGAAINPATPVGALAEVAAHARRGALHDRQPGLGRAAVHRALAREGVTDPAILGSEAALEVDGGIDPHTAPRCREAGASLFVAGSAIFAAPDPGEAYRRDRRSVDAERPTELAGEGARRRAPSIERREREREQAVAPA